MILEIFCFECNKICLNFGKFIFAVLYFFHYSEISTKNMFFKKNVLFTKLSLMIFFFNILHALFQNDFPTNLFSFSQRIFFSTKKCFSQISIFLTKHFFS